MDETAASRFRGMMPWSSPYAFTDLGGTPPTTPGNDEWYPVIGSSGVPHVQHLDGGAR